MMKQPSLSSRNTLGESSHHSSNHKCYKEQKLGYVAESYGGLEDDMVDGLCQNAKVLMDSNGDGTYLDGWGCQ